MQPWPIRRGCARWLRSVSFTPGRDRRRPLRTVTIPLASRSYSSYRRTITRAEGSALRSFLVELQRRRVDAVAQSRRARAVVEDVPEVGVAARAGDFDSPHAVAAILMFFHTRRGDRLVE